jgi:Pectate lyase superfamily protein
MDAMNIEIIEDTFIGGVYKAVGDTASVEQTTGEYLIAIGRAVEVGPTSVTLAESHRLKVGMWIALSPFSATCEIKQITGISGRTLSFSALVNSHSDTADVITWSEQPAFNVKLYGAAGDNSTDDSGAFNASLRDMPATGGTIYIPVGSYRINLDIVSQDGITFRGDGRDSKLIMYDATDYLMDIRTCDSMTLEHLFLDGRYGDGATEDLTLLEALTNFTIRHCYFTSALHRAINFDISIVSGATTPPKNQFVRIHDCEFDNMERDAIYGGNLGNAWMISSVTSTTFQINVDIAPGASFTFAWRIDIDP